MPKKRKSAKKKPKTSKPKKKVDQLLLACPKCGGKIYNVEADDFTKQNCRKCGFAKFFPENE